MAGREGTTLGPYTLTRALGSGGAGEVYLADGPAQGGAAGQVALKVLHGSASDPSARAIAQQAHAVSALRQTHVLPLYAVGEAQQVIYLAMAYAPGGSMAASIRPDGVGPVQLPLGAGVVARLTSQCARALHSLHAQGHVHGDLKLANLFVRTAPQGGPMLAISDFGQAEVTRAAGAARAADGERAWFANALLCAAPEQLNGHSIPASDQYALAAIAYLLLTGQYPFTGEAPALRSAILSAPPTPPTQLDPTLPLPAEAALLRGLAKAPEARFPDISAFAQALSEGLAATAAVSGGVTQQFSMLAGGAAPGTSGMRRTTAQLAAMPRPADGPGAPPTRPTQAPARPSAPPPRGARQRIFIVAASVIVVALLIGGALGWRALTAAPALRGTLPNFGGLDYAPTLTPNPAQVAQQRQTAQQAEALLAAATHGTPVYSDSLAHDTHQWAVDGKQVFFGPEGRLHVANHTPQTVASVDMPVDAPANFAVSVNMTFVRGSYSDLAGIRVRVGPGDSGGTAHFTILISPQGLYQVWHYDGSVWVSLDYGYSSAIQRGLNQTNQLAVIGQGTAFWIFVNGHYVTSVRDGSAQAVTAPLGPTVIYEGTEVAYDHLTVYAVGP